MLGIERVMDHIAHDLGRDPLDVRRANYYAPMVVARSDASGGDISGKEKPQTTPYGMEVEDFILHEMTEALVVSSDYDARRVAIDAWNAVNPILKKGIALTPVKFGISFTLTHLNQAGALVHVYSDGSVHMNHGGTEMGQGLFQKVAQVAAARFGIDVCDVKITATDTSKVPNTSATAASSGSDLNGMAVKAACDTIRDRMANFLAERHGVSPTDVVFADGTVRVAGEEYSFAEAASLAYQNRISLSATGFYKTPDVCVGSYQRSGTAVFSTLRTGHQSAKL